MSESASAPKAAASDAAAQQPLPANDGGIAATLHEASSDGNSELLASLLEKIFADRRAAYSMERAAVSIRLELPLFHGRFS